MKRMLTMSIACLKTYDAVNSIRNGVIDLNNKIHRRLVDYG